MIADTLQRFVYQAQAGHRIASSALYAIERRDEAVLVVFVEPPDNSGASVVNGIEALIESFRAEVLADVAPEMLQFIEFVPARRSDGKIEPERFDLVVSYWDPQRRRLQFDRWRALQPDTARALGLYGPYWQQRLDPLRSQATR